MQQTKFLRLEACIIGVLISSKSSYGVTYVAIGTSYSTKSSHVHLGYRRMKLKTVAYPSDHLHCLSAQVTNSRLSGVLAKMTVSLSLRSAKFIIVEAT